MWKKQTKSEVFPHFSSKLCPKCKKKLEICGLNCENGEEDYPILVCETCDMMYDYYEFD